MCKTMNSSDMTFFIQDSVIKWAKKLIKLIITIRVWNLDFSYQFPYLCSPIRQQCWDQSLILCSSSYTGFTRYMYVLGNNCQFFFVADNPTTVHRIPIWILSQRFNWRGLAWLCVKWVIFSKWWGGIIRQISLPLYEGSDTTESSNQTWCQN